MSQFQIPSSLLPYLLGEKTDYSSFQPSLLKVNIVFLIITVLMTGLRCIVRIYILRAAGLDDLLITLALGFAILLSVFCLIGESFGLGKHLWNLNPELTELPYDVARITKALYGCYLAYSTAITFTKLSIMATYARIFPNTVPRYVLYAIGIVVLGFWISSIFAIIFTCVPIEAAWDYTIRNARCIDILMYLYISAGFNVATDMLLCFLPLPTIWNLKMPKTQRVVVCLLFSLGTFACIASILRLTQLRHLNGIDVSYQTVGSLNWSVIEVGTGIICASFSTLRPLATRNLPRYFAGFTQPTGDVSGARLNVSASNITRNRSIASRSMVSSHIHARCSFDVSELELFSTQPNAPENSSPEPVAETSNETKIGQAI
ncbi:hypothetical protein BKA65DRAFT_416406 [Rhexocercosporidium sp. MPI-PUGE-AT-0058]|nr:hypothetical protein BKA65DRAFT_416406 [Rhexocercosporidium sp. MPI-PUGE-AT-0058]